MNIFDFEKFPVLTTERLRLRRLRPSDAAAVLVFRGDPVVQKYNSEPLQSVAEAAAFINELNDAYDKRRALAWGITLKEADAVIGAVSLHSWYRTHRCATVGYDLAHAYWGRGIGSEAVRAVLHFGFEQLNLNRIEAPTIADNHESVGLLKKLGFTLEGIRRACSWEWDGTFHDSAMFGLLRDEFLGEQEGVAALAGHSSKSVSTQVSTPTIER